MVPCKITVLKTLYHPELSKAYRHPELHHGPCDKFTEGDTFIVEHLNERPEGFSCGWAWEDLEKTIVPMMQGAKFSPWLIDENTFITCCTDGIKPVIFKLERIEG